MNTETFGETLHSTLEERDRESVPSQDPLVKLGFTPSFNTVELYSPTIQPDSAKETYKGIPPFRVDLVDLHQAPQP